eukprot:5992472-Amphidinium_carterae.1
MLNTQSLRRSFRNFCENNGLSPMLYKFLDNDGNMKQQYIQMDNGIEHDHKQAMALHKWNRPEPAVYNGQNVTMRVGTPPNNAPECYLYRQRAQCHHSAHSDNVAPSTLAQATMQKDA